MNSSIKARESSNGLAPNSPKSLDRRQSSGSRNGSAMSFSRADDKPENPSRRPATWDPWKSHVKEIMMPAIRIGLQAKARLNRRTAALQTPPPARSVEDLTVIEEMIQKVKVFASLSQEYRMELCRAYTLEVLPPGFRVYKQGDYGSAGYTILKGKVVAMVNSNLTSRPGMMDTVLGPGDTFGEYAVVMENNTRAETVVCETECDLMKIDKEDYDNFLRRLRQETLQDKVMFLKNAPIFCTLPRHTLEGIAFCLTTQSHGRNELIVKQGDAADDFFLLVKGECIVLVALQVPTYDPHARELESYRFMESTHTSRGKDRDARASPPRTLQRGNSGAAKLSGRIGGPSAAELAGEARRLQPLPQANGHGGAALAGAQDTSGDLAARGTNGARPPLALTLGTSSTSTSHQLHSPSSRHLSTGDRSAGGLSTMSSSERQGLDALLSPRVASGTALGQGGRDPGGGVQVPTLSLPQGTGGGEVPTKKVHVQVAELQAGDYFGEVGILSKCRRTATVVSSSNVELLVLKKTDMMKRLDRVTIQHFQFNMKKLYKSNDELLKDYYKAKKWELFKDELVEGVFASKSCRRNMWNGGSIR